MTPKQREFLEKIEAGGDPADLFRIGMRRLGGRQLSAYTRVRYALGSRGKGWIAGIQPVELTQAGRDALEQIRNGKPKPGTCRVCGCTESNACAGGCAWADGTSTICTACQPGGDE